MRPDAPGDPEAETGARRRRRAVAASVGYAAVVVAVLAALRTAGGGWWPATPLWLMPRWLFLLPCPALALAAGRSGRRGLWGLHGATAAVVLGPLMGASLPVGRLLAPRPGGLRLRVMTLNRGSDTMSSGAMIRLIKRERVQIICFQEGTPTPALRDFLRAEGWYWDRRRTVMSRLPIVGLDYVPLDEPGVPRSWSARLTLARVRAGPGAEFGVVCVHLPTARPEFQMLGRGDVRGLRRHFAWRRATVSRVADAVGEVEGPVLLAGDFNMPSDCPLFAPFRRRFRVGFDEAGWGYGYTRPSRLPWVRIDHVLASREWTFTRCWVGPDLESDHLPLLAEVVLSPAAARAPTPPPAPGVEGRRRSAGRRESGLDGVRRPGRYPGSG